MSADCDVVVVGAGPAGSAAATVLARGGRRVVLLDRDAFPRDKLCGEFLSGEAFAALDTLGAGAEVETAGPARLVRARMIAPSGRRSEVVLPQPALGVSRRTLDLALVRAAERAGAVVRQRTEVVAMRGTPTGVEVTLRPGDGTEPTLRAPVVVAACGRSRRLGVADTQRPPARAGLVGVKRHHRCRGAMGELDGVVEVHAFDGGYCGVSAVEGGLVNVCALLRPDLVRSLARPGWDGIVLRVRERSRSLDQRLAALEPAEPGMHTASGIALERRDASDDRVFYAGDAAGMIAPFCGDGQAMALRSGMLLATLLLELSPSPSSEAVRAVGREWERRHHTEFATRLGLGRLLQPLLMHRALSELAIRGLLRAPRIAGWIARRTRG